jgi:hypothetical protein
MKRAAAVALAPLLLATAAPALDPAAIAGQYVDHGLNGDISGRTYYTDDVLEIVPVRKPIRYMARLRGSAEFKDAMAEDAKR